MLENRVNARIHNKPIEYNGDSWLPGPKKKKTMLATHSFWTYQVKRTDGFVKAIRGKALGKALSSDVLDLPTCKLCVRGKVANLNPYGEICREISTFL